MRFPYLYLLTSVFLFFNTTVLALPKTRILDTCSSINHNTTTALTTTPTTNPNDLDFNTLMFRAFTVLRSVDCSAQALILGLSPPLNPTGSRLSDFTFVTFKGYSPQFDEVIFTRNYPDVIGRFDLMSRGPASQDPQYAAWKPFDWAVLRMSPQEALDLASTVAGPPYLMIGMGWHRGEMGPPLIGELAYWLTLPGRRGRRIGDQIWVGTVSRNVARFSPEESSHMLSNVTEASFT